MAKCEVTRAADCLLSDLPSPARGRHHGRRGGGGGHDQAKKRRIALACDGSKNTLEAVQWTLTELVRTDDTLVLVHVLKPDPRGHAHDASQPSSMDRVSEARRHTTPGRSSSDPHMLQAASPDHSGRAMTSAVEEPPATPDRQWSVPLTSPFSRSKGRGKLDASGDKEASTVAAGWIILNRYQLMCREAGVTAITVLVRGEPGSSFVDVVKSQDCDIAVLGSRCLGAISRAVFSSVGTFVIQHLECPTLVYRSKKQIRVASSSGIPLGGSLDVKGEVPGRAGGWTHTREFRTASFSMDDGRDKTDRSSERTLQAASSDSAGNSGDVTPSHTCPSSPVTMLGTPGPGGEAVPTKRRRRIGVGVDGSMGCAAALSWALKNIYRSGDIIVLINCQPLQFIPGAGYGAGSTFVALEEKAKVRGNRLLEKYKGMCEAKGVRSAQIFARGDAGREVVEVSEAHHCTVIVIGAHGSTQDKRAKRRGVLQSFGRWLFGGGEREQKKLDGGNVGGVAFTVSHTVHTPVVVVRRQEPHANDRSPAGRDDWVNVSRAGGTI